MLCKRYHKKKIQLQKKLVKKVLATLISSVYNDVFFQLETNYKNYATFNCGQLWNQDVAQVSLLVVQTDVGGLKCRKTSSNLLEPAVFVELHEAIQ